jgi:hypothetical protein
MRGAAGLGKRDFVHRLAAMRTPRCARRALCAGARRAGFFNHGFHGWPRMNPNQSVPIREIRGKICGVL